MAAAMTSKYGQIQSHRERDYFVTDHAAWRWKDRMPAGRRSIYTAYEAAETAYGFERYMKFKEMDEVRVYSAVSPHGTRYSAVFLVSQNRPRSSVVTTYRIRSLSNPALREKLRHIGEAGGVIRE